MFMNCEVNEASGLERLAAVTSKHQQNVENRAAQAAKPQKPKQYQWKPQNEESMAPKEAVTTPSGIKEALEYEKTPELAVKIIEEGRIRDGIKLAGSGWCRRFHLIIDTGNTGNIPHRNKDFLLRLLT